jgi:ACT domain-containing protein
MNAVIAVIGKDSVGILAKVSDVCMKKNANVIEVSQTILNNYFAMIMVVDILNLNCEFTDFIDSFEDVKKEKNVEIHIMHEDIFNAMHKI